ncbi:hypothetical protein ACFQET_09820 [Levilactobacillus tangyuanensis]|uniref:Uncharacterized protein n=1 Tax=Levilactobacillus tangyuanensis TaxID=2486021 RepID=A0ABW1TSR3_9LACO|nr:hypothetical protein [Levilactobacillus tangyuanensis]
MTQATAGSTSAPRMEMSPERATQVVKMTKTIRQHFPELAALSDAKIIYATWRSFKRIDQTNDSDYHTMAKVFFQEFDKNVMDYQLSKNGREDEMRQRFFAILTDIL